MAHPLPVSGLVEGGGQDGEARAKTRWPYAWVPKEEAKRSLARKGCWAALRTTTLRTARRMTP